MRLGEVRRLPKATQLGRGRLGLQFRSGLEVGFKGRLRGHDECRVQEKDVMGRGMAGVQPSTCEGFLWRVKNEGPAGPEKSRLSRHAEYHGREGHRSCYQSLLGQCPPLLLQSM